MLLFNEVIYWTMFSRLSGSLNYTNLNSRKANGDLSFLFQLHVTWPS